MSYDSINSIINSMKSIVKNLCCVSAKQTHINILLKEFFSENEIKFDENNVFNNMKKFRKFILENKYLNTEEKIEALYNVNGLVII